MTRRLNLLPAKGGVSDHFGPRAIMTSRNLDYTRDLKYPFGCYVQASVDTTPRNSNIERTIDCLYLQPASNLQEGHEVMHIQTGELMKVRRLTKVPMTQAVIDAVNKLVASWRSAGNCHKKGWPVTS